jgi:hypothetical protein
MILLFQHEAATDRWEPLGVGEAETAAAATAALAELAGGLAPGRFRYLPTTEVADWRYLELDADGLAIESLT